MKYKPLLVAVVLAIVGLKSGEMIMDKPQSTAEEVTISAAISLKEALSEVQQNYQAKYPHVKLTFNFGGSGSLQKQIEQGAPVDIFISAAPNQVDQLASKGLIVNATRRDLVKNQLVLIVPKNSRVKITGFEDLLHSDVQNIALGEPETVPAGQYAKQVLERFGVWNEVKNKAVFAKDVRAVLTYTATGNTEAGLVYKTDTAFNAAVDIVATAPEGSHQTIVYPMARTSNSPNAKQAELFMEYLMGSDSQAVLKKYGFISSTI